MAVVQKADILVNLIASADPDMSTAGAVSKAFHEAAGPQLQAVTRLSSRLRVYSFDVLSHAGHRSCLYYRILLRSYPHPQSCML